MIGALARRGRHLNEAIDTAWRQWRAPRTAVPSRADRITVLFFNRMWGRLPDLPDPARAPGFTFTTDTRRLTDADVVIFHLPTLGPWTRLRKRPGQIWVAWFVECEAHYPRMRDPAFMTLFDLSVSYHREADVFAGYCEPFLEHELRTPPRDKAKDKLVALFMAGRADQSGRETYITELMRHVDVHSYGSALNTRPLANNQGRKTKLDIIPSYKFTLAFENAIADDYVTEKIYDPLIAGSVPVYLGAPNVDAFAPADHCYINVGDFDSPKRLAEYLLALNDDEPAYQAYLSWKSRPFRGEFHALLDSQRTPVLQRLCEKIHTLKRLS